MRKWKMFQNKSPKGYLRLTSFLQYDYFYWFLQKQDIKKCLDQSIWPLCIRLYGLLISTHSEALPNRDLRITMFYLPLTVSTCNFCLAIRQKIACRNRRQERLKKRVGKNPFAEREPFLLFLSTVSTCNFWLAERQDKNCM